MNNKKGKRYDEETKLAILKRMLPPENISATKLSQELGIPLSTIATWKKRAIEKGTFNSNNNKRPHMWSSEDKFHIVLETASMNEQELSIYCRNKGILREQIQEWKLSCLHANKKEYVDTTKLKSQLNEERQIAKDLKKELRRKEKALAEAAALLVLQKKAQAIWGDQKED